MSLRSATGAPAVTLLAAVVMGSAPGSRIAMAAQAPPAAFEDWYPADITPPEGTRYPCALTALPRALPGIPEGDRRFVNHAYSLILRATQAKLVALKALEEGRDMQAALARYQAATAALLARLADETPPAGLEPFRQDLLAALKLQRTFFERAGVARTAGRTQAEVYSIPEGRQASGRLIAAWGKMQRRYPAWSRETSASIYHHLCALDLF